MTNNDKKKSEDDEFRQTEIYEAFSIASAGSVATPFTEDDEPLEFPKINDEDYHLGEIKYSETQYNEAKDYYLASYDTNTKDAKCSDIVEYMLQEKIAMCYFLMNDFDNSIQYYQDAIKDLTKDNKNKKKKKKNNTDDDDDDNINDEDDEKLRKMILFRIYMRLANLYVLSDESEDAIKCYTKAFPILVETKRVKMNEEITGILS